MAKIKTAEASLKEMDMAAFKAGYWDDFNDDIDYVKMAKDRKWITKDGQIIKYSKMETNHIVKILEIYEGGRFKQRAVQEKGLREELLSRMSTAGKVLFGHS